MLPLTSPCLVITNDSHQSGEQKNKGEAKAYVPSILPLPEGLDLGEAERRLGGRKAREKLGAVVSAVIILTCRWGKEAKRRKGYVPLPAPRVERLIGKRYAAPALRALVDAGILEPKRHPKTGKHAYSVGHYSKAYRLAPALWRRLDFVPVSDPTLAARLRKHREEDNARTLGNDAVNTAILRNLGSVGVPVSFAGLAATLAEQEGKDPVDVARWQLAAHELTTGRLWFSRADARSRAFHSLTNLPRPLRALLTLTGETMAEVDIANAQPFFLLALYPEGSAERRDFALTVARGGFYDALFYHLPRPLTGRQREAWGNDPVEWKAKPELKEAFKEAAFRYCLYCDHAGKRGEAIASHPIRRSLSTCFPELSGILASRLAIRGSASDFSREMQRREAELVLGRVFPRILAELSDCAPVSLHDAVLCQARSAPAVKRIMEEETCAVYGVTPTVRVKPSRSP